MPEDTYFTARCKVCGQRFAPALLDDHVRSHADVEDVYGADPANRPPQRPQRGLNRLGQPYRMAHRSLASGSIVNSEAGNLAPPSLIDTVAGQLEELTRGLDAPEEELVELPTPPATLTYDRYAEALASARKNCEHPDATNVVWGREWWCAECERPVLRAEMVRLHGPFEQWFYLH